MEIRDLILELCFEAGDAGPEDGIVIEWEDSHGCCCRLNAEIAAQGNIEMVNQIRACMGLRVPS